MQAIYGVLAFMIGTELREDYVLLENALLSSQFLPKLERSLYKNTVENSGNYLKNILKYVSKEYDGQLRLCWLDETKLTPAKLLLAYKQKNEELVAFAKLSTKQALVRHHHRSSTEVILDVTLQEEWTIQVIEHREIGKKPIMYWFIPDFVRHSEHFSEILVIFLFLQIFVLILLIFFQFLVGKVLEHQALSTHDVLVVALVMIVFFELVLKGLQKKLPSSYVYRSRHSTWW